jgi:small ligand-binding sensory domain FIST
VQTETVARFGDGLADDADLLLAAENATAAALEGIGGSTPDLLAVFVAGGEPDTVAEALLRAQGLAGAGASVGCSAPGVIGSGRGIEAAGAVAVWCGVLPGVRARSFALEVMPSGGSMAIVGMPDRLHDDEVAVLVADPWSFPVDGFVEQINATLPGLPVVGGLAAGATGRGSTRMLLDDRVVDRGAVGVLLGGPVRTRTLVSQGCRPVGPAMTVTASDANVILELAGMSAIRKLHEILEALPPEEQAMVTTGLQLGVARSEYIDDHVQGDFLIRGVAGVDEARGGLIVGDLVPVGRTVKFQVRDATAADVDLRESLAQFQATSSGRAEGALLFSCNGRGAAMFGSADHDPTVVRAGLAPQGLAGCFAAGEIGPVAGKNFVHAFTASMLVFESSASVTD